MLAPPYSLDGGSMLLQLGSIGCISEDERAKDVDVKVAEVRNNSDCVEIVL